MRSSIVFIALLGFIGSVFTLPASQTACSDSCTDYHRLCPAVKDPSFFDEYKAKQAAGELPNLPDISDDEIPEFKCSNEETKIMCPRSCDDCVPCSKDESEVSDKLKALEERVEELESNGAATQKESLITVLGMVADPAHHGHPETTIDKAFEGSDNSDYKHCYVSESAGNNQASFDIEPSSVTKLMFLNRRDCCDDWLNGIEVRVCVKGGACQYCGVPHNVAPGAWSTVDCPEPLRGNEIRMKNTVHHLQFCELKIYGTRLPSNTFPKLQPISVTGMVADPAYHGHQYTTIDKAFEGSNSLDHALCYVSEPSSRAQARFDIEPAQVVRLEFLNRHDCCTDWLDKTEVRVCVKGFSCQMCGKPPAVIGGGWSILNCQGQLEGNEIQLYNPAHHVQFCEMHVLGIPLEENNFLKLEKIRVTGWVADPAFHGHPHTTIEKAFEGTNSVDGGLCYVSNTNGLSQASIDIEPAKVYQLKLLNRQDCCTDWLDTIEIKVCVKGGICHNCGNPAAVPGGSWATLDCQGGPIEGNEIQFYNGAHHLQFCELMIYGTPLTHPSFETIGPIAVTGMTASAAWPGHPETTIDKAFDGSISSHYTHCYVSKTPTGGDWANIDIQRASVYQIKLLNRVDCCDKWLDTIEIKVCEKGGACKVCGTPGDVPGGNWVTVTCAGGPITGNEIQMANHRNHLQFCEMKIYGKAV